MNAYRLAMILLLLALCFSGCESEIDPGGMGKELEAEIIKINSDAVLEPDGIVWIETSSILTVTPDDTVITWNETLSKFTVSKKKYKNVKYTEDKENFYMELIPRE